MKNLDPRRARGIRLRMGLLCGVMALGLGGFVSSAYHVQVEEGASWRETAEKQRQRRLHIEPKRGTIYDRNGTPLAVSVEVPSVSADVAEMLHGVESAAAEADVLRDAAARLGQALSLDPNELYARLATKHRFLWVKRRITSDEASAVRDLGDAKRQARPIHGLAIEGEGHRYYPGRELAGPVLGFVAPDGQGKDGLELALDDELRGHLEEVKGLRDRAGHLLFSDVTSDEEALEGHDVTLTLDEGVQHLAEQELDAAQKTYETKGASIVVLDPNTGEVLAIASTPGYNPNDYGESDVEARRDRAVTDRFEPGSAMKVFTLAAALATGSLQPTESIFCEHGSYKLGTVTISDTHVNDWLTPTQILAKSSNIGALKVGLALGEPGLYAAFRRFGFGEPTGLPLPGEAAGVLRPRGRPWFEVETAIASFGQGVSVTTVQLATAFASIANGGRLLEPLLVRRITDGRGRVLREGVPHVRRETVSPQTAHLVTEMLTAVTEEGGTAVEAAVPGFRVAGKTGDRAEGRPGNREVLDRSVHRLVHRHRPGGAPAARHRRRARRADDRPLRRRPRRPGLPARRGGHASLPGRRAVRGARPRQTARGCKPPTTTQSRPRPCRGVPADAAHAVAPMALGPDEVRIPDAVGLCARDALKLMTGAGLLAEIEGSGRLVRQSPQPGAAAAKGSTRPARLRVVVMTADPGLRLDELLRELPSGSQLSGDGSVRDPGRSPGLASRLAGRPLRRAEGGARRRCEVRRRREGEGGAVALLDGLRLRRRGHVAVHPRGGRRGSVSPWPPRPSTDTRRSASRSSGSPGRTGRPRRRTSSRAAIDGAYGGSCCGLVGTVGHSLRLVPGGRRRTRRRRPTTSRACSPPCATRARPTSRWRSPQSRSRAAASTRSASVSPRSPNLTQDHLDYHGTMEAYAAAKAELFTSYAPGSAVIHVGDPFGRELAGRVKRRSCASAAWSARPPTTRK